ncbi:MAG: dockerin type I repeat-containing protein, partial [Planctomycetota bacterium]
MRSALLLLATMLLVPNRAPASEFVRGDANNDGLVTPADAHFILQHFYWSLTETFFLRDTDPPDLCWKAADVDDDGLIEPGDAYRLLEYLMTDRAPPTNPFPNAGEDPTLDAISCESKATRIPLEDSDLRLRIEGKSSRDADGIAVLTVFATNPFPVGGFSARVSARGVLLDVSSVRVLEGANTTYSNATVVDGELRLAYLSTVLHVPDVPSPVLEASPERAVLEISVCLTPGAEAQEIALELIDAEFFDALSGESIRPEADPGTLGIAFDVPREFDCEEFRPVGPDDTVVGLARNRAHPTT